MIAQDTGSAIVGPARADLYFGAGLEAGKVSGRLRHNMRFVILIPKSLNPAARGRKMPIPDERPSEKIAKLFPQVDPLPKASTNGAKPAEASASPVTKDAATTREAARNVAPPAAPPVAAAPGATQAAVTKPVPLPEARPNITPVQDVRRRHHHRYRHYRRAR
jgi:membrane-bound lytic murein transglycosylase A